MSFAQSKIQSGLWEREKNRLISISSEEKEEEELWWWFSQPCTNRERQKAFKSPIINVFLYHRVV
jgi:hypothetical protein